MGQIGNSAVRPELISRPRLIERLNAGLHRKLTLISAPAGFGKTTLLSEWGAGCGQRSFVRGTLLGIIRPDARHPGPSALTNEDSQSRLKR